MKTIKVDELARVEGEGALRIRFKGDQVRDVELRIFEPPRFFEAFLRGRSYAETPDITARICGICPVAYQMSACQAMEDALGVQVEGRLRELRRLIYWGEWIESHALHMFFLHAPDFLGCSDAFAMARDHRDMLNAGLQIKKVGNAIVRTVGGREVHPVNVRVGGFYRLPTRIELGALLPELGAARDGALKALEWFTGFSFPDFERDYEFVALRHRGEYAVLGDRLVSNKGLDIEVREYERNFVERQVPHSNALHSVLKERGPYVCGPMARFNLNFENLTPLAKQAAVAARIPVPCRNPFMSILVRAVETIHALDDSIRIIEAYEPPSKPFIEVTPRASTGFGCTEAPRGLLYHRYRIGDGGIIEDAKIVPPTSQNQKSIEQDLFELAPRMVKLSHDSATAIAEQAIRNYDPCISCATHFLRLTVEHE